MFNLNPAKKSFPELEEQMLQFWKENDSFKKSIEMRANAPIYTFYDGPPFATGMPHYGHILAGTIKDIIPRYQTMKGRHVPRRFGWDCHGLPVEYEMEKELNLSGRKDIEDYGVKNFCESCRGIVQRYTNEWEKTVERMGRWVDFENSYKTMDSSYMESILWVFKSLWDKKLIFKDHKSMHICPRCATTLSNFEVSQGYKDVDDVSVTAKFELLPDDNGVNPAVHNGEKTFILAWTTTPWTLPSNLLLAVGEDIDYIYESSENIKKFHNGFIEELNNMPWNIEIYHDLYGEWFSDNQCLIFAKNYLVNKYLNAKIKQFSFVVESQKLPNSINIEEFNRTLNPNEQLAIIIRGLLDEYIQKNPLNIIKGKDLVGKKYKPLYDCAKDEEGKKYEVVSADFVSTEDGTGVVHIAPAFGDDDLQLGKAVGAPFFQPLGIDGIFTEQAPEFLRGEDARDSNKKIVQDLKERNLVFESKNYRHSYPHCWRCDTALLNFSTSSYFVKVTEIKDSLLKTNQEITWVPDHLKDGRFGKWLEGARDWAISRNRFWGAPIPIWKCDSCDNVEVAGSIKEISEKAIKKGKIFVVRHGEGEHNIQEVLSSRIDAPHGLTEIGKKESQGVGENLKKEQIDLVFSSPLKRTQETTEEILNVYGKKFEIVLDERIREVDAGKMEGKNIEEWRAQFKNPKTKFFENPHEGESLEMIEKRVLNFLSEIQKKYPDKNILIVTHADVVKIITKFFLNLSPWEISEIKCETASLNEFSFSQLPLNDFGEIDLHRPYIDNVKFKCEKCSSEMSRVPDVLDCWFESGSMPYAQDHYPFENAEKWEKGFPADFIAEGLDQTRGWFYTLHVLANALFEKPAFQNVITNGIVLAEDGQKMSKSKKNYPDPQIIFDKYGADAMRFYMLSSPVVRADDLRFTERGVEETLKGLFLPLKNSFSFFASLANIENYKSIFSNFEQEKVVSDFLKEIISEKSLKDMIDKTNASIDKTQLSISDTLNQWILAELRETIKNVSHHLDNYDLDKAAREIPDFIDKLTNWYIRRSKRFFWESDQEFFVTLFVVLIDLCRILAPFSPFYAESIYQSLKVQLKDAPESIHLCDWPDFKKYEDNKLAREEVFVARKIVNLSHKIRANKKIRIRQPLQKAKIYLPEMYSHIFQYIKNVLEEEMNIKNIEIIENPADIAEKIARPDARKLGPKYGKDIQRIIQESKQGNFEELNDMTIKVLDFVLEPDEFEIAYIAKEGFDVESDQGFVVALDTEITEELKEEGIARDLIRTLQDMRKEADFQIADRIEIAISGADEIVKKHGQWIASEVLAVKIEEKLANANLEKEVEIEGMKIYLAVKK